MRRRPPLSPKRSKDEAAKSKAALKAKVKKESTAKATKAIEKIKAKKTGGCKLPKR